jgi:hypothetical protein
MMARSFPPALLDELRALSLRGVLECLDYHVAVDPDFVPDKDRRSERWVVSGAGGTTEVVVTGIKWFDTRAKLGGGGAIDLVMQLERLSFVAAVRRIERALRPLP